MAVSKTDPSAFVGSESTKRVWDRALGLVGVFHAPSDCTASRPISLAYHLKSVSFLGRVQAVSYHRVVRRACGSVCIDEEERMEAELQTGLLMNRVRVGVSKHAFGKSSLY